MSRKLLQVVALATIILLLAINGMVYAQTAEHASHHAHHQASTHGSTLCTWLCAAGQMADADGATLRAPIVLVEPRVQPSVIPLLQPVLHRTFSRGPPAVS